MIKALVYVPEKDNEGRDFPRSAWLELAQRLRRFGGFTRGTDVQGEWEDAGRIYRDLNRQYTVALASWEQLSEWLAVVRWAQVTFAQEAMYIEVAGIPEILRGAAAGTPTVEDQEDG